MGSGRRADEEVPWAWTSKGPLGQEVWVSHLVYFVETYIFCPQIYVCHTCMSLEASCLLTCGGGIERGEMRVEG